MNQILKIIQREFVFYSKGRNFEKPLRMLSFQYYNYRKTTYLCDIITFQNFNIKHSQMSFVDFFRTYATSRHNSKESESVLITKPLSRIVKRKKFRDTLERHQRKIQKGVEYALLKKKIVLKNTRRKIQEKGKLIIQDLKKTKNKMKEKIEEVIERENVYTIPNMLCVTRIALSPYLSYLIVFHHFEYALMFMLIAGISDLVDGWIARNYKNQSSKIGTFLDPMADKVLIGTLFLSLTYIDLIPVALTGLIVGRDVILIISGFVIRYRSLPPPKTLSRYFDVTHATAQLAPTFISKVNTGIQLTLVGTTLIAPILGYANSQFLHAMWYITAVSTVAAAASYVFSRKTYKYLKKAK